MPDSPHIHQERIVNIAVIFITSNKAVNPDDELLCTGNSHSAAWSGHTYLSSEFLWLSLHELNPCCQCISISLLATKFPDLSNT